MSVFSRLWGRVEEWNAKRWDPETDEVMMDLRAKRAHAEEVARENNLVINLMSGASPGRSKLRPTRGDKS